MPENTNKEPAAREASVRPETKKNKYLYIALGFCILIIVIFLVTHFSPSMDLKWILGMVVVVAVLFFAYDMMSKKRFMDKFQMAAKVADWAYQHEGIILDVSDQNVECNEVAPQKFCVYFRSCGTSYFLDAVRNCVIGEEIRALSDVKNDVEKGEVMRATMLDSYKKKLLSDEMSRLGYLINED